MNFLSCPDESTTRQVNIIAKTPLESPFKVITRTSSNDKQHPKPNQNSHSQCGMKRKDFSSSDEEQDSSISIKKFASNSGNLIQFKMCAEGEW